MKRLSLLLGLWIGLLGTSHAMTAGDVLSRARFYLKDQASSTTRQTFTDATLLQFVSDGQREANSYAWLLQQRSTFTLVAGTTEYALPADFIATQRVIYNKGNTRTYLKLDQTSLNQLDADRAGWMGTSGGTPLTYYIYLTTTPVIGFVPSPVTTSTGTIQVDYVANTLDVDDTSDVPFNGWPIFTAYHSNLVYYVVCRGYRMMEEYDLATPFCDEWLNSIATMRSGILKQPDFNPGFQGRRTP